jgi:hypothetical protein
VEDDPAEKFRKEILSASMRLKPASKPGSRVGSRAASPKGSPRVEVI